MTTDKNHIALAIGIVNIVNIALSNRKLALYKITNTHLNVNTPRSEE